MPGALRASRGHHHLNLQEPYYLSVSTQQVTQTPRLSPAPSQVAGVRSSKWPHQENTALVSERQPEGAPGAASEPWLWRVAAPQVCTAVRPTERGCKHATDRTPRCLQLGSRATADPHARPLVGRPQRGPTFRREDSARKPPGHPPTMGALPSCATPLSTSPDHTF